MDYSNSILGNLMFDPFYLILGLGVLTLILLVVVIVCIIRMKKLYRRYDIFMRGKDAETLEDTLLAQIEEIKMLKAEDRANKDTLKMLGKLQKSSFQKMGIVKYDAFQGMGGKLSFCLAVLDSSNTGFVMNSVHGRECCYNYLKEIINGTSEVALGHEEKEALEAALEK